MVFLLATVWAVADFYPAGGLVWAKTGILHVAQVFVSGDGTMAQGLGVDCVQQGLLLAGL